MINLAHILVMGPLLLAIGLGYLTDPRVLIGLGSVIVLYHIYKAYGRWSTGAPGLWINLLHVLAVGPAIIAAGWLGTRAAREIVLMLGIAAVGYHAYYLISA